MNRREANDLDNYITGHYGEDQFRDDEGDENPRISVGEAESRWNAAALARYERVLRLERQWWSRLNETGLRLLRLSQWSFYLDLVACGLREVANVRRRAHLAWREAGS